jgi:hypothetical protein
MILDSSSSSSTIACLCQILSPVYQKDISTDTFQTTNQTASHLTSTGAGAKALAEAAKAATRARENFILMVQNKEGWI